MSNCYWLSQPEITARLKVSQRPVHVTLKHIADTVSVVSKARSGKPKVTTPSENQYIKLPER